MKEKLKNYFNKDRIFVFICLLCIIAFCVLYAILYANDKKQVSEHQSTIILNEDEKNLYTSWSINQDGNLVGNNLVNESALTDNMAIDGANGVPFSYSGYRASEFFITISPNTSYSKTTNIQVYFYDSNKNYLESYIGYSISSFSSPERAYFIRIECFNLNSQIMLNLGSTLLDWEPYGVWYSATNYDNLQEQFDIVSGQIKPLTISHISSNTLILNSVDVTSQLGGSIFLSDMNGGIGFYNSDFDAYSSFSASDVNEFNLVSIFNKTYTIYGITAFVSLSHSAENYLDVSIYRDNQLILSMNDLDSETTQEYMQTYSNQEIQFNKIIMSGTYNPVYNDRTRANYIVDNNNYAFGYQQGYNDSSMFYDAENTRLVGENAQLNNDLTNLDAQYTTLSNNYNSLLEQYNLLNNDKYTFTELFWSISAVPFGVLTSAFNVNVLGFNLAAIITGLFTSLLLIWLIKKFFK